MGIVWFGIAISAGCYPLVIGAILFVWSIVAFGLNGSALELIGGLICFVVIGFGAGMMYGVIMALPAYLLTRLLRWSSGGVISDRGASGIFGGMTGFLYSTGGSLPFMQPVPRLKGWELQVFILLLFSSTLLAIVMGYLGAIWAGYRNRDDGFPFFEPIISVERKFTIGFMMKLTAVVAVLAIVCKAIGTVGLYVGIAWVAYFVVQAFLLFCDHCATSLLKRSGIKLNRADSNGFFSNDEALG